MKHLFIINPAAGSRDRTEKYTKKIEKICTEKGVDFEIRVSQAPGNCTEIAREAAQSGENYHIYSCGGDGTLNEVVAGVAGYDNVAITMFAGGSGNDFIKIFNETEPFRDLERLLDYEEATFDLIKCNDDYSLNICSVGLDARIGHDVANYKRLPLLSGFRAYALSTVVNVVKGISEHYVVEINGERIDGQQTLICACNGRFYGGGFCPVPTADPTDGKLEVLLIKDVSRLKVAQVVGAYKAGKYASYPDLIRYFSTDHVKIICDKPTGINLDGEKREAEIIDMSVAKEKIRFFYPKGITFKKEAAKEAATV
jgi:YegS/Rv2252/BmrU family lipid kinase